MKPKLSAIKMLVGAAVLLGAVPLLRTGYAWLHNSRLQTSFSALRPESSFTHYLEHRPMEELPEFPLELDNSWLQIETHQPSVIRLRAPLRYYSQPDPFSEPYLEIPAGTELELIAWQRGICRYPIGYGFFSYPTYDPGWRMVSPFLKYPNEDPVRSWDEANFYYVRLEDLESVRRDYLYDCMRTTRMFPLEQFKTRGEYRAALEEKLPLLYVDEELMRRGYYLSPDLLLPLWDGWNTALCILAAVCILGCASRFLKSRPHGIKKAEVHRRPMV